MLHFHIEISLEEGKEHCPQFRLNIATASLGCLLVFSFLLKSYWTSNSTT